MRIEPVIAVPATDGVGPTKLRLLTAASARLPVVVVVETGGSPSYHVFTVASLRAALTDQLSTTVMLDALDLGDKTGPAAVGRADVASSPAGLPVVENGRLIGVTADDVPDYPEPGEQDMARGGDDRTEPAAGGKRGWWKKLSGSGN